MVSNGLPWRSWLKALLRLDWFEMSESSFRSGLDDRSVWLALKVRLVESCQKLCVSVARIGIFRNTHYYVLVPHLTARKGRRKM